MTTDLIAEEFDQMMTPESDPPAEEAKPSITGMTAEEMVGSLTGFEELAIAKRFGQMGTLKGTMAARALITVHLGRAGVSAEDAYQQSMNLPQADIDGYFDVDDEITPDSPETESGKDASPSDIELTT